MQQLSSLRGAIHIHSRYSDGSDSMEQIIAAAKDAGLQFVIVTDHNVLKARKLGWEGWHDGVLVVVGCEISPHKRPHCLALNIDDCEGYQKLQPPEYLRKVKQQGGFAFVAHPEGHVKKEFILNLSSWQHWDNPDYEGMEIWSYMHDWIDGCHISNMREYLRNPEKHISGPSPDVLQMWDRLAETRRVVGIGALDNHAANVPLRKLRWKLFQIFPHRFAFRTVRTHVLMPVTHKNGEDVRTFISAITMGRCFVDYAPLGDGSDFRFTAHCNGNVFHQGDELRAGTPVVFRAASPCPAEITLLRNGLAEASADGTQLEYDSQGVSGTYRIEARIKGQPWLFSNHIYVRP